MASKCRTRPLSGNGPHHRDDDDGERDVFGPGLALFLLLRCGAGGFEFGDEPFEIFQFVFEIVHNLAREFNGLRRGQNKSRGFSGNSGLSHCPNRSAPPIFVFDSQPLPTLQIPP